MHFTAHTSLSLHPLPLISQLIIAYPYTPTSYLPAHTSLSLHPLPLISQLIIAYPYTLYLLFDSS